MELVNGRQKNIVILGAGYGGLRTALRLEEVLAPFSYYRINLIDQNQHHQLVTQLHEVAGGRTPASATALPLAQLLARRRIDFLQARVTGLDTGGRRVLTDQGEMNYDYLVIAFGSETNFFGIPGMQEHAFSLKSLRDACLVQGHIHEALSLASGLGDPIERREALTFLVGGGGFTGVELAAELMESLRSIAPHYGISSEEPRIAIVEAGKAILPGLDSHLVARATRALKEKGVEIITGTPAKAADARGVLLASGERVNARTLIWAGGVRAPEALERWGLPTGVSGRVKVNGFLQVDEHQEVFAVGDNALVVDPTSQRPSAPSAQLAVSQGEAAARNILASITGGKPRAYHPHMSGEAVSLGSTDGVAWVGPARISGRLAQWLKVFIARRYLWETGGLALVGTYAGLGKLTLGRDFPECLIELKSPVAASETQVHSQVSA
ncbi:MAG: NAD(P)/FAD-dependent oxidoreductase [Dehalococcoidia bacterium]|nr:NAD(P)/FAD-dependent oxidoreductase [Dehalococcoidia bacterium]